MLDVKKTLAFSLLVVAGIAMSPPEASAKKVKIKLGTLAPEGSPWHNGLLRMTQRWSKISNGNIESPKTATLLRASMGRASPDSVPLYASGGA